MFSRCDHTASHRKFGHWLLVAALLAGYYALALSATLDKCVCADEIAHLTAGYSYLLFNDYRLHPENGNIPQRLAALPLLLSRPTFPDREQPIWRRAHIWKMGQSFFYHSGNDPDWMLLQGRAMMGVMGVLLGLLVYGYSRWLFGPAAGILSLALFVICPNLLAHGPLINSDTTACLFFLASLAAFWWVLHEITWSSLIVSGLVLGGLFLAKFSAVIILPVMGLLALLRVVDGRALPVRLGAFRWTGWQPVLRRRRHLIEIFFGLFLLLGAAVFGIIWAFYGFRYAAFNDYRPEVDQFHANGWETVLDGLGLPTEVNELLEWSRENEILPEAHLYGFAHTLRHAQKRDCFLNGEVGVVGWPHFFPYAFLVKTPLGTLIVLVLALLSVRVIWKPSEWRETWRGFYATAPLWFFLAVYWGIAIKSQLNIGHRHILPTYPPMFILAGAAVAWLPWGRKGEREKGRTGEGEKGGMGEHQVEGRPPFSLSPPLPFSPSSFRWIMAVLLLASLGWAAVDSLRSWPNYLAYFNQIVGGPRYGYRHLVDSSLDWGQDLPGLKHWLDQHNPNGREAAHLAYFGTGDPDYYGIRAMPLLQPANPAAPLADPFTPGIYAISATYFQGVYLFPRRPWNDIFENDFQTALSVKRCDDAAPASTIGLAVSAAGPDPFGALMTELGRHAIFKDDRRKLGNLRFYRFARLCTYLQQREPDDEVNYSILIFRVTEADLRRAFEPGVAR